MNNQNWREYITDELETVRVKLGQAGYNLHEAQPHTLGERFLMQNITITSGKKLILLGKDLNGTEVVIKVTKDAAGKRELAQERMCRDLLHTITFSYERFHTPEEVAFWNDGDYTFSIQTFIDQECAFLERSLEEQFEFAVTAFKIQESARATTASHYKNIADTFGIRTSSDYIKYIQTFLKELQTLSIDESILHTCTEAEHVLQTNQERIEQYCGFLTHTDFVPHNFRIKQSTMYLLDTSSLEFGNKHESWARFLNFMTLYNYKLEALLIEYIEKNRATEERQSLQLMRIYRLVEIITYYSKTVRNSEGDLAELNTTRVHFWHDVLQAEIKNTRVDRHLVETYRITRDRLRSSDEKERQKNLH